MNMLLKHAATNGRADRVAVMTASSTAMIVVSDAWEWLTSTRTGAVVSIGSMILTAIGVLWAMLAVRWAKVQYLEAQRANALAERIAKAAGTFEHSDLILSVYDESSTREFVLALPIGKKRRLFQIPLPYQVVNSGKATAEDVEILLRANKEIRFAGGLTLDTDAANLKNARGGLASETEHTVTIASTFDSIHPRQAIEITDALSIRQATASRHQFVARTADGMPMKVKFSLGYSYALQFVIMQRNKEPITRSFAFWVIDTSGMTIHKALERASGQKNDVPPPSSGASDVVHKVVLLVPDVKRVAVENHALPTENNESFQILRVDTDAVSKYTGTRSASGFTFPTLDPRLQQKPPKGL